MINQTKSENLTEASILSEQNLVNTFINLVKIDSTTGYEKKISLYIYQNLKNFADYTKRDKWGNIYARINGKGESVFFASHMDTVEPGHNIKPKMQNGYIVSDGTTILGADNKVAVTCVLELAQLLHKKNNHRPVEFIFTTSEEVGNLGAINFDYSLLKSKIGYCFDSSNPIGTIIYGSPYYERFDIKIIGKEAHASMPNEAKNVLSILSPLFKSVKLGQLDESSIINIGVINGGFVRNTIPGELFIKGEIRSFYEYLLLKHKKNLIKKIISISKKSGLSLIYEFVRENSGYTHKNKKTLNHICKIKNIMKTLNIIPYEKDVWGITDANIFNEKKLLCINFGDGTEFTHTKKERVRIRNLKLLFQLMLSLSIN